MKKTLFSLLTLCCMTLAWAQTGGTDNGSKGKTYEGVWYADQLVQELKAGDYLDYNCTIVDGGITVYDNKLDPNHEIMLCQGWDSWAVGDPIDDTPWGQYSGDYANWNTTSERKTHKFFVTEVAAGDDYDEKIIIKGYYTGYYYAREDGFMLIDSAVILKRALGRNSEEKVKLTADIYLSDIPASNKTYMMLELFKGTIDGDGHTIWAARPEVTHDDGGHYKRSYFFKKTYLATVKNITFKNIRVDSSEDRNQGIIAREASDNCVFENLTFDNVSIWCDIEGVGAVAGEAIGCTFKNITVLNSDFTTDRHSVGAIVGSAETDCSFTGCVVDDQTCVCSDGLPVIGWGGAGGIAGWAKSNCTFIDCINSAFVAGNESYIGGIAGTADGYGVKFDHCLNTGMVISIEEEDVPAMFEAYKTKTMPYHTRYYKGKEYAIRTLTSSQVDKLCSDNYVGGIVGILDTAKENKEISYCVNYGSICTTCSSNKMGGIVGVMYVDNNTSINNCFTDFQVFGNTNTHGIIGDTSTPSTSPKLNISNCLSVSNLDMFGDSKANYSNNYSLYGKTNSSWAKTITEAQLASGEVCNLLGWEQNIGTDALPMLTGNRGIYHTRTVSNTYGTVCLPFAMNSDDNMKFYTVGGVDNSSDAVIISFNYVAKLEAGHPALFSIAEKGDITLEPVDDERMFQPYIYGIYNSDDWHFMGTYEKMVFEGEDAEDKYYISKDQIRNAAKVTIDPFRAYFQGPGINGDDDDPNPGGYHAKAIQFVVTDEDGETTALEFVGEDLLPVQSAKTFTIMGTEANEGYRGIVIRGGKKQLIY